MRRILDSATETRQVPTTGGRTKKEEVLAWVEFEDHIGAIHRLEFHPEGFDCASDDEPHPRILGEYVQEDGSILKAYTFTTPEEAVNAYENGQVV